MKTKLSIILLFIPWLAFTQINTSHDRIKQTKKFTFHSNFWVNMHHFLYQQAKKRRVSRKYAHPEREILRTLSGKRKQYYEEAIKYYHLHFIKHSLVFDEMLVEIRNALIQNKSTRKLQHRKLKQPLIQVLNNFAPVYKKYLWKMHHQANMACIKRYLPTIKNFENKAFELIAKWAQNTWLKHKIRVDLSKFTNWAGAYTTDEPIVTISSVDKRHQGTQFIEILFHEPSHSIISAQKYAVAKAIAAVEKTSGQKVPRGFWHKILFYFAGKATQQLVEDQGKKHRLYMQDKIVSPQNFEVMEKYFAPYFAGQATLEESISNTIKHWRVK